ncbi:methyl-accepting chemotaxis protein [Pseudorhizobium halotolerans]|uniref:Methyl-accepting chemotaxis protein n=4 Tax=Pseudorhizobium TaxID=1903858 RepID=A0A7W9YWS0_9HYPH|nr:MULTISPECIES: methyl-accepting chemotaxis protein [Pseudorhizobium]MBB6179845.1 methyl-accepting chemotaxis protein [Pseudorhizobium flavum]CAD6597162.1 methyl-accepting chemotaxis protein [Pseudorhizobium flavum]CAD7053890.1 methyl-accepting chemotaxis protein [Pseudorhizobium halotolerans]
MFANLRISRKLLIAFSTITTVVLLFSAVVLISLTHISRTTSENAQTQKTVEIANIILSTLVETQNAMRGYAASADKAFVGRIDEYRNSIPPMLSELERALPPEVRNNVLSPLRGAIDTFNKELSDTVSAVSDPALLDATRANIAKTARLTQTRAILTKFVEDAEKVAAERALLAEASFTTGMTTLLAGGTVTAIIAIAFGVILARSVATPVIAMTNAMTKLAAGDTNLTVPAAGRADEIGKMADAVEVFRQNAAENRRLEQEANAQRSQSEEQRRRTAEQERIRAEAMAQATTGLADGLKQLSAGNLGVQLTQSFAEEFEGLREDFNRSVMQLRETMTAVAESTSSIDSGSREISQSAEDLSKRTEQQAASLEETAAALDQITTNVANSSKRAEEARAVAIQANENARHSGAVVANAVDAMGKIEQSSNQISSIIGVIDDIAFQTNLLALNAGVEAARAGEAGKGFAVVAQEVRELAQRSATAAKEIKDLIRNSSAEVGNGVKLVSDTGEALKTIESYIVTINQHMDAIATSAREQSVGLSEVNTAVNQMDQVTQQNAAMVEEANAAGATLANEASRLRGLIGQFQLGGAATYQPMLRNTTATASMASSASPARGMVNKIARTFAGKGSAAVAVSTESWEEF